MNLKRFASCCIVTGLFLSAARVDGQASCGPTFLHTASYPAEIQFPQAAATGDFTGDGLIESPSSGVTSGFSRAMGRARSVFPS